MLVLGGIATLVAGGLFYCASSQQRLLPAPLSALLGVGGGTGLITIAVIYLSQIMSPATTSFMIVLLLMIVCCLLPVLASFLKLRNGRR
ncbi:hypothetical protein [Acetobacter sp.]|uniref:hypothetical protein n=1 Tax=Acetobacter sp. TaxID=440 RepID=UPI0039ED2C0F